MQGIRKAQVQFGDNVVVIGLGLLGQIAAQILKAAGAHVIGIDVMKERVELAKELGANICLTGGKDAVDFVLKYTNGLGADSVIIYAAAKSNEPVKQAMEMARKKGRVVVVGAVGMALERAPFYEKELDFLISCSYGPGRYDSLYEEKGCGLSDWICAVDRKQEYAGIPEYGFGKESECKTIDRSCILD